MKYCIKQDIGPVEGAFLAMNPPKNESPNNTSETEEIFFLMRPALIP
jgi:hypothetical protein